MAVDSSASCDFREACTPRTALVVGLGKTGLSCVEHLSAKGVVVSVVDSRATPPALDALRERFPRTQVRCGGFDPQCFEGAELIVASPGVPLREAPIAAAAARGVPVIGDIELFARAVDAPVVAVTGSNGKSTVASMVGEMARRAGIAVQAGANLGEPALSLLGRGAELYVLELSSFQLERTFSLRPAAAVVLNVAPDHMDRYRSIDEYADTKRRIYDGASVAVVNLGDPRVRSMVAPLRPRIAFSLHEPEEGDFGVSGIGDGAWLAFGKERLMRADRLPLAGSHNLANALAALALGYSVGLPFPPMLEALRAFHGLAHRCELVADRSGVRWYNDSKATNVGATLAAIEGLGPEEALVLIAGGEGKGADFSTLRPAVAAHVRAVVLFGRDAPLLERALRGAAPLHRSADLREAVECAGRLVSDGGRVLFSPACASFDMFDDYRARGRAFTRLVRRRSCG